MACYCIFHIMLILFTCRQPSMPRRVRHWLKKASLSGADQLACLMDHVLVCFSWHFQWMLFFQLALFPAWSFCAVLLGRGDSNSLVSQQWSFPLWWTYNTYKRPRTGSYAMHLNVLKPYFSVCSLGAHSAGQSLIRTAVFSSMCI